MAERQPKDVLAIMGVVDTYLRHREKTSEHVRSYKHYHPSEWGKCLRTQQYKHYVELGFIKMDTGVEELDSKKLRLFDKGHNMHRRWQQDYFANMGVLRGVWRCMNPLCYLWDNEGKILDPESVERKGQRVYGKKEKIGIFKPDKCVCGCTEFLYEEVIVVDESMNMIGHADLILDFSKLKEEAFQGVRKSFNIKDLPKKPIVADMKTINDWQFKGKVLKFGPHKEYQIQISLYAHILGLDYGLIIYENKNDSSIMVYKVEAKPEVIETIKTQAGIMQKMVDRKLLPPPRPDDKASSECKYCNFRSLCHSSPIWDDEDLDHKRNRFYKNLI